MPELILATIDPPVGLNIIGSPKIIEARICRPYYVLKNIEKNATSISESIFFIEYHLHSQLIRKMKFFGKNAIFGLNV